MRHYSLLTRLSLSHALVTLAGLALLGATLLLLVQKNQRDQTLRTLTEQAQVYAAYAAVADNPDALATLARTLPQFGLPPDTVLRVLAPTGTVLFASSDLGPFPSNESLAFLPAPLPIQPVAFAQNRRFVAIPVVRAGETLGVIELSRTTAREQQTLQQLTVALLPSVLLALAGAALGGHLLARSLVRPLHRLEHVATAIARGDRQVRSADHAPDEIGRLAEQFNRMTDELEARLADVERLADARQQFYRSVSHELRTPLTAIRGAAENLEDDALPEQQISLQIVQREAERLQRLVEELLQPRDAAPLPIRQRHPVDLQALVGDVRQIMLPRAERLGITLQATTTPVAVMGDDDRLKQALLNVIDNALKFTPAGGSVMINAKRDGKDARVVVRDTGPGIDPVLRERIWERGVSSGGGQGLGLAFVREIVQAHGGTATLIHEPGTTVELRLPLHEQP
jgi:signal transduction histidine kinase